MKTTVDGWSKWDRLLQLAATVYERENCLADITHSRNVLVTCSFMEFVQRIMGVDHTKTKLPMSKIQSPKYSKEAVSRSCHRNFLIPSKRLIPKKALAERVRQVSIRYQLIHSCSRAEVKTTQTMH